MRKLLILIATASLALGLSAGEGRAVITEPIPVDVASAPPPFPALPPGADTPPPSEAISDPVEPAAVCGDWHRTSSYGGAPSWSSESTWWEYSCSYEYPQCVGACNADWIPSIWADYFYWDGSQSIFYGEFYGDYYLSSWGWPACEYWWDAPTNQWYRFESPDCSASPPSNAAPTASFTVSCSELSCSFDAGASADTDGTIQTYSWTFGDETSGSGKVAEHAYAKAGTYTVGLAVTDNGGASSTDVKVVSVGGAPLTNAPPTASFTFSCSSLSCSFDPSGSVDNDGSIAWYSWNFGDGTTAGVNGTILGSATAYHTYGAPGSYTVTLVVTDDWCCPGATATDSKTVAVTNAAPTPKLTITCSGSTCSFDGSGSADPDGTIKTYSWNFGDGNSATGSGNVATHTYAQPATYNVALTVTDNAGASGTDSAIVTVLGLSARAYKVNGLNKVDLTWNGSSSATFAVYRNGSPIATVLGGLYTDINKKGTGSYTYKVCAAGTTICSNQATVRF
jgi:PKD repeat protein